MGEVEGLVVLAAAVRVREDGVGFLQKGELLSAPSCSIRVAILRQGAVRDPDLFLRGFAGDTEHLVVVDLIRHRLPILTHRGARGPARERKLYLL